MQGLTYDLFPFWHQSGDEKSASSVLNPCIPVTTFGLTNIAPGVKTEDIGKTLSRLVGDDDGS